MRRKEKKKLAPKEHENAQDNNQFDSTRLGQIGREESLN